MRLLCIIFAITFLLGGCGRDEFQDLKDFVKNSGANMRGKIEPPPEVKPYVPFPYDNSAGLPSPFQSHVPTHASGKNKGAGLNAPDMSRHKEELEQFPLDSLKMVGYLNLKNTPNAIIRAPDGKLHHVKVGNYMGQNFGHIVSITETSVTLKEMIEDGDGNWTERTSTMQLIE